MLTAAIAPTAARLFPEARAPTGSPERSCPLAFAGLARPEVAAHLTDLGVHLGASRPFRTIIPLPRRKWPAWSRQPSRRAAALITTAKDWARLGEKWDAALPLWVLEVEAQMEPEEAWHKLSGRRLGETASS